MSGHVGWALSVWVASLSAVALAQAPVPGAAPPAPPASRLTPQPAAPTTPAPPAPVVPSPQPAAAAAEVPGPAPAPAPAPQPAAAAAEVPAPAPPPAAPPPPTAAPAPASPEPPPPSAAAAERAADSQPAAAGGDWFELEPNMRAQNTWYGPTGGVWLVDAGGGPVGTGRLQLDFDFLSVRDFLSTGDQDQRLGGVFALSLTPAEHVEAFASLSTHSNTNTAGEPVLLQVVGDLLVGIKGFTQLLPWLGVGGDARLHFMNTIGDLGVILEGTSIGLRGAATADLRRVSEPLPLILRTNFEYLIDNSSALIEDVEDARYEALDPATRLPKENEDRHLVTRIERFALGINRLDMLTLSLGVEAPLPVTENFFVQPLLEWRLGIPVNRQGYSCLAVNTDGSRDGEDGCLAVQGLAAAPSTLTIGARVLPPVRGLSALLAFDIGLLGTDTFVRELAPNRPWAFLFAAAYTIDTRAPKPEVRYVRVAEPTALARARLRGQVVERGFGTAILGAIVRYPDLAFSPQLTGADGGFISYELEPGLVNLEITHPDYEPGRCAATIPQSPAEVAPNPYAQSDGAAGAPPPSAAGALIDVRCELSPRPRSGTLRGSLVGARGAPVEGVTVELAGASAQQATSDAAGSFVVAGLPVGDYVARVDSPAYFLKSQSFTIGSGTDTNLQLVLVPKPKNVAVTLTSREVKIRKQIKFKSNSSEIDERSGPLLSEIADVLQRNPQAAHVQVQGHTDNVGDPATNLALSQQRAESVVRWLVGAGVSPDRLEAKGYGDSRPIVPNLTPGNRGRNRRVQFIVRP